MKIQRELLRDMHTQDEIIFDKESLSGIKTHAIFCSIQISNLIVRKYPQLISALFVNWDLMKVSSWSSILSDDLQLEPIKIWMPFGKLISSSDMITEIFGDKIFVKPNSGKKSFTGDSTINLRDFVETHKQISNVFSNELCVVSKHINLPKTEYRCWVVDSKMITCAPYGWETHDQIIPAGLDTACNEVAKQLLYHEQQFVVDFIYIDNKFKVIELNNLSTSGWYYGMNVDAIIDAMEQFKLY